MGPVISRRHVLAGVTSAAGAGLAQSRAAHGAQEMSLTFEGLSAVPTFNSIGLYWRASSGSSDREASARYRRPDEAARSKAHNLWFDERSHEGMRKRGREYRGSIVGLQPGSDYEVEVHIAASGESARRRVTTWSEEIPFKRTVRLASISRETLAITESG